jgi:hypothetical protein
VLSALAFIIFRNTRRRRQAWEREVVDPSEPVVPPTRVEKLSSPSPGPPSGSKDAQLVDHDSVPVTETLVGGSSTPGPSMSQMATVPLQPISRRRPLPVPTVPAPSTPATTIPTTVFPSTLNPSPSPSASPGPPSNHNSTLELTHLTPEEARFVHSLYSQNVPHGEIVDMMRLMRAERGTGSNPTERGSGTAVATTVVEGDAPPAYNVGT